MSGATYNSTTISTHKNQRSSMNNSIDKINQIKN